MEILTDFGDIAVVLPLAAVILIWLAVRIGGRTAFIWLGALLACGAVTSLLKVYFKACSAPSLALHSPSGHTSMSTFVYGGLVLVIGAETQSWRRLATGTLGAAAIIAIAVSRIILGAHSVAEVVVGLIVGAGALAVFMPAYLHDKPLRVPVWPLAAISVAVALLIHGNQLKLEPLLGMISAYIHGQVPMCG